MAEAASSASSTTPTTRPRLDKKLVKLARWLGTKVLRLDSFIF
jgi:hypothetical protein